MPVLHYVKVALSTDETVTLQMHNLEEVATVRLQSASYGNDPIKWLAALPTAGQANLIFLPSLASIISGSPFVLSWPLWASD